MIPRSIKKKLLEKHYLHICNRLGYGQVVRKPYGRWWFSQRFDNIRERFNQYKKVAFKSVKYVVVWEKISSSHSFCFCMGGSVGLRSSTVYNQRTTGLGFSAPAEKEWNTHVLKGESIRNMKTPTRFWVYTCI